MQAFPANLNAPKRMATEFTEITEGWAVWIWGVKLPELRLIALNCGVPGECERAESAKNAKRTHFSPHWEKVGFSGSIKVNPTLSDLIRPN